MCYGNFLGGLSTTAIILIIVGCVVGVALIGGVLFVLLDGSIEMEVPYQQQHHQQTDEESGVTNPALVVEDWWDFLKKCVKINWFDYFKIIITYYVCICSSVDKTFV